MNAKADWLKKNGELLVPKTLTSCVFDADGNSVDKLVENIKESIPTDLSQLNEDADHKTVTEEQIAKWNQGGAEVESVTVVNVKNHGVKGDGVTDDTQAIQDLLDTIDSGVTLYFPQGVYKITDTLVVKKHLNIIGETRYGTFQSASNKIHSASTLNYVGDGNKSLLTKGDGYVNLTIQNMSFYGNSYTVEDTGHKSKSGDYGKYYIATSTKENVNGVDLTNTNGAFFIADCYFQGFSGNALIATQHKKIFNCAFYKCNVAILLLTYDCLIDYCWICRCSIGILTTTVNTLGVYNTWFDQMEQHAIKAESQLTINMNSCWIDMVDYSAICLLNSTLSNARIDARMSRCAMAYAGATEAEITKEEAYKACTIYAHLGQSCYINITPQRRTIDGTNNTGICPTAVFGSDGAIKDSVIICPTNTNDNLEDHLALTSAVFKNCVIMDGMQIKKQLGAFVGTVPYVVVRTTNPPSSWKAMNKGDLWINTTANTLFYANSSNAGDFTQLPTGGGEGGEADWYTILNKPNNLLIFEQSGELIEINFE